MNVAIVGGGAAGFFTAINVKENFPDAVVVIFEKSTKVLSKVKVSGGGRCNITNGVETIKELSLAYPRGANKLKKAFGTFSNKDAFNWFESRGVPLITQPDNCVFPQSQNSQSIIDCFMEEINRLNIKIHYKKGVKKINPITDKIELTFLDDTIQLFDKVVVATGGALKRKNLEWLEKLGHQIEEPVPSLFTFNMPNESITKLMGIVVEKTLVNIQGTKLKSDGPLLITHWGMSGPAILKLSAFGARILSELNYDCKIQVNWVNTLNNELVKTELQTIISKNPNKQLSNIKPYQLQSRLWSYLLDKIELPSDRKWKEIGKKGVNKLVNILTNDIYSIKGKTTFKEEFVTCGGVSLNSIDFKTMQSMVVKNLYFTGEILDIDGITGGYNFQAAWTTAFVAAKLD
jgi:predicted Rossmann fold flavoprotein